MDDTYLTISRTSEGIYKEKMSKFLAFAIPVSSVDRKPPEPMAILLWLTL